MRLEEKQQLNQKRKNLKAKALDLPQGREREALEKEADDLLAQIQQSGLSGDDAQSLALTYELSDATSVRKGVRVNTRLLHGGDL